MKISLLIVAALLCNIALSKVLPLYIQKAIIQHLNARPTPGPTKSPPVSIAVGSTTIESEVGEDVKATTTQIKSHSTAEPLGEEFHDESVDGLDLRRTSKIHSQIIPILNKSQNTAEPIVGEFQDEGANDSDLRRSNTTVSHSREEPLDGEFQDEDLNGSDPRRTRTIHNIDITTDSNISTTQKTSHSSEGTPTGRFLDGIHTKAKNRTTVT